jgi:ribose transport system substrate-binding protein
MMTLKHRRSPRTLAAAALALSVLALAACGGSSSSTSTSPQASNAADASSGSSGSSGSAYFNAQLNHWYKGTFALPTGPSVKAPTGKHIWIDSAGNAISASVLTESAIKEAASKLGWTVTVYDAQFDPTKMLTGVQQATAAKADGIILLYVDCSIVQTALQTAKTAGIPVVGIESQDCQPSLEYPVHYVQHMTYRQLVYLFGQAQADWVIVKTNDRASTVVTSQIDSATVRVQSTGTVNEFTKCPACKIADNVKFTGADIGPSLQAKIQQALIQHPEANSFIGEYDAIMTQGGAAAALRSAGRLHNMAIMGGEGSADGIAQIRNGTGMQACVGEDVRFEGYGAVDALVRLFLHRDPSEVDTGIGIQVCDKDHNLPPAGQPFQPPVNYVPAFYKLWGVG